MENSKEHYGYDDASRACGFVTNKLVQAGLNPDNVKNAIIIGSGLGSFTKDHVDSSSVKIPFNEIFANINIEGRKEGVEGHAKQLVIGPLNGELADKLIIAQDGREHPYEGISIRRAVFWLRIMQLLGVETLLGSNAIGIVTPKTLQVLPSLILVHSHRDFADDNPLVGNNDDRFGPRFPHSGDLYPAKTRKLVQEVAAKLDIPLKQGTLFRFKGPEYESRETIYDLRGILENIWRNGALQLGEDRFTGESVGAVGMSSTYEHLVAQHASQSEYHKAFHKHRAHISAATNYAAGLGPDGPVPEPTHEEVKRMGCLVEERFGKLAREVILEMQKALQQYQQNCQPEIKSK
ncbi:hypothetical protein HZA39_04500 [Candidatus Peregrinibacteria bacterium]|nr:hypothetical protein [Candidatus Peregrinibacteria bacterium]